jgi:hypothetical protein
MDDTNTSRTPDPLVKLWLDRIATANKHWSSMHKRAEHCRKLVANIQADSELGGYSPQRANLISSTLRTIQSRVYAKNPEIDATPKNNDPELDLFVNTIASVTQAQLEDANLKQAAKRAVRSAMTTKIGVVKVLYQRDMKRGPTIQARIEDAQENLARIDGLIAEIEDENVSIEHSAKRRELQELISTLEAGVEVVASEGLCIDVVRTDRILIDPAVEDFWDYPKADWIIEKIPMRKTMAKGIFKDYDLDSATTYRAGKYSEHVQSSKEDAGDDPMIMVFECWSKSENKVYTLVDGCTKQFARAPYNPEKMGERWYPYFIVPFETVDGKFEAQSLVDSLETLQEEHNAARSKEDEVRKNYNPHYVASSDSNTKNATKKIQATVGEVVFYDTNGLPIQQTIMPAPELSLDPGMVDTSRISQDWEMVSGLQDAARSTVVDPKTATEASIMEQSLAAKVADFRDQIEDWLSEICKFASELCLWNLTPQQVESIMGPAKPDEMGQLKPSYSWIEAPSPENIFGIANIKVRAGSTGDPNKLKAQQNWLQAMPVIQPLIMQIRQIEMTGGDATPERELVKETAARFDEHIDIERFLPKKPTMTQIPGMPGMPAGGLPEPSIPLQ